jgi:hypothetical protein
MGRRRAEDPEGELLARAAGEVVPVSALRRQQSLKAVPAVRQRVGEGLGCELVVLVATLGIPARSRRRGAGGRVLRDLGHCATGRRRFQ